jgi:outer membrane protein TolC
LLAEEELSRAQRRYTSGLSTNLDVTDAQNRLTRARENRISALYHYNAARIELLAAMGTIRLAKLD